MGSGSSSSSSSSCSGKLLSSSLSSSSSSSDKSIQLSVRFGFRVGLAGVMGKGGLGARRVGKNESRRNTRSIIGVCSSSSRSFRTSRVIRSFKSRPVFNTKDPFDVKLVFRDTVSLDSLRSSATPYIPRILSTLVSEDILSTEFEWECLELVNDKVSRKLSDGLHNNLLCPSAMAPLFPSLPKVAVHYLNIPQEGCIPLPFDR